MSVTPEQLEQWQQAVGRRQQRSQILDLENARRFSVAAGHSGDLAQVTPALLHWAWFMDVVPDEQIGPDGHPKRGAFLPDISLPRRMFAAAKMDFFKTLELGRETDFSIEIKSIAHKQGSTGNLVFAEVERSIAQGGSECIRETQTLVYREAGDAVPLPKAADIERLKGDRVWQPTTVNLFRFSAVTFNSHRIHYDREYAMVEEGYPSLVVHGPYTATVLADFANERGVLKSFQFRGVAPIFEGQPVVLRAVSDTEYHAIRCDGAVSMIAKVTYQ